MRTRRARHVLILLLALGLSGAVLAGPNHTRASTYARVLHAGQDAHLLAALERARSPLVRRAIRATYPRVSPTRFGQGTGKRRSLALRRLPAR